MSGKIAGPLLIAQHKIPSFPHPALFGIAKPLIMLEHGPNQLYSQALAPLGPSPPEDGPAAFCPGADQETMGSLATRIARLICSFHGWPPACLCCWSSECGGFPGGLPGPVSLKTPESYFQIKEILYLELTWQSRNNSPSKLHIAECPKNRYPGADGERMRLEII